MIPQTESSAEEGSYFPRQQSILAKGEWRLPRVAWSSLERAWRSLRKEDIPSSPRPYGAAASAGLLAPMHTLDLSRPALRSAMYCSEPHHPSRGCCMGCAHTTDAMRYGAIPLIVSDHIWRTSLPFQCIAAGGGSNRRRGGLKPPQGEAQTQDEQL